jgi:multiple sugar transport system substrate-binding protein
VPVGKGTGALAEGIFPVLNEVEGEGVLQTLAQDLLQGMGVQEAMQKADERLKTIVE